MDPLVDLPQCCKKYIILPYVSITFANGTFTGAPVCSQATADIVFVVDSSGSIRDKGFENWDIVLEFISDIVGALPIGENGVRVGMVVFSNNAENGFYLNDYYDKSSLINQIINSR